jgi:molybdopterin-guanine dinucleotide biosynthesis protein A
MPGPAPPTPDGVVLAGGAGSRMGRPKADVPLAGVPLAARAVALLAAHCGTVVVVARPGVPLPPLDARVVLDRPGPAAALTGLLTGLAACTADDVLVLACDMPLAGPAVAALAALPPGTAAVAAGEGGDQPLCARYPRLAALALGDRLAAEGRLAVRGFAAGLSPRRVPAPAQCLLNVNDPGGVAAAEAALREGA